MYATHLPWEDQLTYVGCQQQQQGHSRGCYLLMRTFDGFLGFGFFNMFRMLSCTYAAYAACTGPQWLIADSELRSLLSLTSQHESA